MPIITRIDKNRVIYDKKPPAEGTGHGYIVFVAVTIIATNCSLPLAAFGIVFGKFLSNLGDETTGTSLANGIFNTTLSFTGLAANILLNKWSCRNVGILGALACSISCFSLVFVQDLISFIVFFGVFQGFGYGLLVPASLTALNNAFDKKLSFMQSLSQALMVACTMFGPHIASTAMNIYGYRGTLLLIGGASLFNIPSAVALSRISWKYRQISKEINANINNNNYNNAYARNIQTSAKSKSGDDLGKDWNNSVNPLLKEHYSLKDVTRTVPKEIRVLETADGTVPTLSVAKSVIKEKSEKLGKNSVWKLISIDFSLLKNLKYLNIAVGLSLSFTSDICFISIIPLVLSNVGFSNSDIALTMSIFFGCDLVSRIVLSAVSAIRTLNSRYLVLWGSLLSVLFRVAFVWYHSFLWKTVTLAALGFLRCFIQTPLPLVISEEYHNQFATAYSLYMVVCGVVTLIFGPLMGVVKSLTNSDVMVCHLLTSCYVICVISWMYEMMLGLRRKRETIDEKCLYV